MSVVTETQFSENVAALQPSATLAVSAKVRQMIAEGKDVLDLCVGEPDFNTPSFASEGGIQAIRAGKTRYTPAAGIPELRAAIAKDLERLSPGRKFEGHGVVVTAGGKQALFNTNFAGQRVVFADIDQHQLSINTRVNWTFTPTLTLEMFAQPFVFAGDYSGFKEYAAPRTLEKRLYGEDFGTICFDAAADRYTADPNGNCASTAGKSAQAFSFDNPDVNVRSLRGNAVVRWEYRPGSTLYLVWQHTRAGNQPFGDFDVSRDVNAIFRQRADNIFAIKASYWIGR